jgi:hypothetical protein
MNDWLFEDGRFEVGIVGRLEAHAAVIIKKQVVKPGLMKRVNVDIVPSALYKFDGIVSLKEK